MNIDSYNDALKRITEYNTELKNNNKSRRLLSVGKRADYKQYYPVTRKIEKARNFNNELCLLEKMQDKNIPISNMDNGNPIEYKYFPTIKKYINKCLKEDKLYKYPDVGGDIKYIKMVKEYLWKNGYSKQTDENNIVFTMSTTQAFRLIIKVIARPYDVILFTAPNYGLFTFIVENTGAIVKCVNLCKEDEWYINPKKIGKEIDKINLKLKKEFKDLNYTPRVVAFFNENPHNPTGKVIGNSQRKILEDLVKECKQRNVFIIDDLIYMDLSYNENDKSLPIATLKKNENLIISLYGVSKSYGLAGVRAGFVVANKIIIQGIKDLIFQEMDSIPVIQSAIIAACFNSSKSREKEYRKYFKKVIKKYKFSLELVIALINGIDEIKDEKCKKKILKKINKLYPNEADELLKGIEEIQIVDKMIPESGFFLVLNFSKIIGKSYKNKKINNMKDLEKIMYREQNIRLLIGESMSWPIKGEAIGRITYALPEEMLVDTFRRLHLLLKEME